MTEFKEINIKEFQLDPFSIQTKWILITAAKADGTVNTMTASWGGFGVMWNKNVVFIVVRPQRHTKDFIDQADSFSLTFFEKNYLKDLAYLGKVSGRDEDKIAKVKFNVVMDDNTPYFEEAHTAIFAKKLFMQRISETAFLDKEIIKQWYPYQDFHFLYIAEVTKVLKK